AFNAQMAKDTAAEPVVAHIKTAYSNDFTAKHGNQAASAVYNTIRHEIGTDLLLIQGCYASGNVYAGDYTEKELAYLIHNDASWPMIAKLTGDQIYQLVEILLTKKDGYGVVCNDSTLYVSSGFEMDITKTRDGYRLNELTRNGRPLDRKARYSLLLIGDYGWTQELVVNEIGCTDYNCDLDKCNVYLYKHLAREGGQLAEPTDYITLR
ncbi:MAG: 5'-nucleotidase C-terminal domain-containing protein, partial [bacterium]